MGIVLAVLVAGGVYYKNYRGSWEEQAVVRLEQVQATMAYGDRETAKADLHEYLGQFEGTVYAMEARLVLGQALLEDGVPEEAIDVLAPAVREMNTAAHRASGCFPAGRGLRGSWPSERRGNPLSPHLQHVGASVSGSGSPLRGGSDPDHGRGPGWRRRALRGRPFLHG